MARRAERAEHLRQDLISSGDQRLEQPPIGPAVVAQPRRRGRDGPLDDGGPAVLQRVGQGGRRVTPLQAEFGQGKGLHEGGQDPQGVDGGADVMDVARQRQRPGPHSAADLVLGLQDQDRTPRTGDRDRGGQAVRPGPHDDDIVRAA